VQRSEDQRRAGRTAKTRGAHAREVAAQDLDGRRVGVKNADISWQGVCALPPSQHDTGDATSADERKRLKHDDLLSGALMDVTVT
jgi:hypothetical protein